MRTGSPRTSADDARTRASVHRPAASVSDGGPGAFERTLEINLLGVWHTVRAALPHVIDSQGYVLVIASLAAARVT